MRWDANNVKVVTERRVVYLMGLVSPAEGDAAAEVAAKTSDVARVVKLSNPDVYASMRGETLEQFLATRNVPGAR